MDRQGKWNIRRSKDRKNSNEKEKTGKDGTGGAE